MTRKGQLAEILSKAIYHDKNAEYRIGYRDYDQILEIPLSDFLSLSENFQTIPASRIFFVKRNGVYLYRRQCDTKLLSSLSKNQIKKYN